jgi:hypothetical protein
MSYTHQEMKLICLELAEDAEPIEAEALRSVASNYTTEEKPASGIPDLTFWQVIAISALILLVWAPISFWLGYGFKPVQIGPDTEQLSGFVTTEDGRYTTRTYRFARQELFVNGVREWAFPEEKVPPVVYENQSLLPKENYEFQALNQENIWRFVTIKTSDGSDPNKNGRKYYAVRP